MIQTAGTLIVLAGILGLFALDRDRRVQTSKALWIAILWLFLSASRPVSFWVNLRRLGTGPDDQLEGSPIDRNFLTALMVFALIILVSRGPRAARVLRANWPILLYLSYCGLSVFWSDFSDVAFKRWIRGVGDITMVLLVLTDLNPAAAVKRMLGWTGFIMVPLALLYDLGRGFSGRSDHVGLTISNKNLYGAISMILALAAIWRFLDILRSEERQHRRSRLLAHGGIAVMAMWSVWYANSGTAKACFLVGLFIIMIMSRWPLASKSALVHLVVVSLIFLSVYTSVINPNVGVVSAMGKDPTLTGRTDVWNTVLDMNPNPLFGAGYESFWLGPRLKRLWSIFVWRPNEAHNGYIEIYLNLGYVGLALLALVIGTGYRKVLSGLRRDRNAGSLWLAYFVIVVIYNLTEAGFRLFSPTWIVFLLVISGGFTTKVRRAPRRLPSTPSRASGRIAVASSRTQMVAWPPGALKGEADRRPHHPSRR